MFIGFPGEGKGGVEVIEKQSTRVRRRGDASRASRPQAARGLPDLCSAGNSRVSRLRPPGSVPSEQADSNVIRRKEIFEPMDESLEILRPDDLSMRSPDGLAFQIFASDDLQLFVLDLASRMLTGWHDVPSSTPDSSNPNDYICGPGAPVGRSIPHPLCNKFLLRPVRDAPAHGPRAATSAHLP
jgi:hypothetical protein